MASIDHALVSRGIVAFECPYAAADLAALNDGFDALFQARADKNRAYVMSDEMADLGLFETVFSEKMLSILFSIMPDPVLYHCHAYEIATRQDQSHIFAERLSGFHRDTDSVWTPSEPTHVSVFVYLSDVGVDDGPFELVQQPPLQLLTPGSLVASMVGGVGMTFAWNRSFYHRASPNKGEIRRRLLKISVQRNRYPSAHLGNASFTRLKQMIVAGSNPRHDLLLGRYQHSVAPRFVPSASVAVQPIESVRSLDLGMMGLAKENLRQIRRAFRKQEPVAAAYD
jgi:hypothetical protein